MNNATEDYTGIGNHPIPRIGSGLLDGIPPELLTRDHMFRCESLRCRRQSTSDNALHELALPRRGLPARLQANGVRVTATCRGRRSRVRCGHRLIGAHIDGPLDMSGASVHNADGVALSLSDMALGSSPFLMGAARIAGQMIVRDTEPGGTAEAAVNDDISFEGRDVLPTW